MRTTKKRELFGGVAVLGVSFFGLSWAASVPDIGSRGDCPGTPGLRGETNISVTIDDRNPEGPWILWLQADATNRTTVAANHQVDLTVGVTGDFNYIESASATHANCRSQITTAGHTKLWTINREVSYCAQGGGIHHAHTDDDNDDDSSVSRRICDTVKPPPGHCDGPPEDCVLVPH